MFSYLGVCYTIKYVKYEQYNHTQDLYKHIYDTLYCTPQSSMRGSRLNDEVSEMTIFKVSKWLIHVHWTFSSRVNAGRRNKTAQNEHKLQRNGVSRKRPITL